MNQQTITRLNQLNNHFYNITAKEFNNSREYAWKGWFKITPLLDTFKEIRVADIGCGNGRFGQFLSKYSPQIKLSYTGIDANHQLLEFAQTNLKGKVPALHLKKLDIVEQLQADSDFLANQQFQLIVSFGVLHHIPSLKLRIKLMSYLASKLSNNGLLIVSLWQFMDYPRFHKKIITQQTQLNQEKIQLSELEKNDYILNWLRGERALRYCHYIDKEEQKLLIKASKLKLIKEFRADGKQTNINQYLVLKNN